MRHLLAIVAVILSLTCSTTCRAYDHATIIGEFYNYPLCDYCDRSLYRYEEEIYHVPHFNVGNGEAGVLLFDFPEELKPFDRVRLQIFLNSYYDVPSPKLAWAVFGFDGAIREVGPSDFASSVPITSPLSINRSDNHFSVDVTGFLQATRHSHVSFVITGNSTAWKVSHPQLLVFPTPEPDTLAMFSIAVGALLYVSRRQVAPHR